MKLTVTFGAKIFYFYHTFGYFNLLLESALLTEEFVTLIALKKKRGLIGTFRTDLIGVTHSYTFYVVLKQLILSSTTMVYKQITHNFYD